MINPLDELSDIYLGQISEADNSPEAVKGRVMQHVRAIRYRARKEGDQLNKAYNDYMAGQAGISATEKSMVKERLGLTGGSQHQEGMAYGMYKGSGKPAGAMKDYLDKKAKKLEKEKEKQKPEYKNNPAFGDPSHHSNRKTRTEAKVDKPMIFGKNLARNERRFGKPGSTEPQGYFGQKPSQAAQMTVKRGEEHKAKRGVQKVKGMKNESLTDAYLQVYAEKLDPMDFGKTKRTKEEKKKARDKGRLDVPRNYSDKVYKQG